MYNILLQEAKPALISETGEVVAKATPEVTLEMIFPNIFTHYVKGEGQVMNLTNIQKCTKLMKAITEGDGDINEVKRILLSPTLDYEHIYGGSIFGVGIQKLIQFAYDTNE